jgi:hypothetical protein
MVRHADQAGFDFKKGIALSTEGILYAGEPLTGLAADEAFSYLGVRTRTLHGATGFSHSNTGCHIDPITDLVGISRYAEATRDQLLRLTIWLAASMLSCRDKTVAIAQVDHGPLTWAQVRLSVNNVQFDDSCLDAEVRIYAAYKVTTKDSCTKIEQDGSLIGIVYQGRFRLLEAKCQARGIATEYLSASIPGWIAHVEKHELKWGFGTHQF